MKPAAVPAFGQAGMSNCEREQIQFAGSIRPHGALLVASEPDHRIEHASVNAQAFLGLDAPPIGLVLSDLRGNLAQRVQPYLDDDLHLIQVAAIEITDSTDLAHTPEMIEGVRISVTRCTELLEHLSWYRNRRS